MNAVPFTVDHVFAGFGHCEGMVRDEDDHLYFEFRIQDALAGVIKSGVREVRIPMADIVSVTLTKGWLGNTWCGVKIVVQANSLAALKSLPGAGPGRIELSIARKDKDAAERFVADLHEDDRTGEPPA